VSSRAESFPGLLLPTNLVPSLVDAMRVVTHGHGSWLPGALSSSEGFRVLTSEPSTRVLLCRSQAQSTTQISLVRNTPALKALPSRVVNAHCRPCSSAGDAQREGLRCKRQFNCTCSLSVLGTGTCWRWRRLALSVGRQQEGRE
jgi:hypothetical protein